MHRQVVTIGTDGSVQGLQVKPGKGFDLRKVGHAHIERASEIEHDNERQKWRVRLIDASAIAAFADTLGGDYLTLEQFVRATALPCPSVPHTVDDALPGHLMFEEYEDAVAVEIAVLDGLRKSGRLLPN